MSNYCILAAAVASVMIAISIWGLMFRIEMNKMEPSENKVKLTKKRRKNKWSKMTSQQNKQKKIRDKETIRARDIRDSEDTPTERKE